MLPRVVAAPNISTSGAPIRFSVTLLENARVLLAIYSIAGELVYQAEGEGKTGKNVLYWEIQNRFGSSVVSGLYVYVVSVNNGKQTLDRTGKIVVIH